MNAGYRLVEPAVRYHKAFLAMIEDFRLAGEDRYRHVAEVARRDFPTYVRGLLEAAKGIGLRPGWVPYTIFWMVGPGAPLVVGSVQLRHWLTPALEKEGGHIGYNITPSRRGLGLGTLQLALALDEIRNRYESLRLDRVLITCDTDNIASARIIQKNGGVFENEVISDYSGKPVSRYWLEVTRDG